MGAQTVAANLIKGSQPYLNLLRSVERAYALAKQHGADIGQAVTFSVPCISYVQGINDSATSEATWNTAVALLQSDLTRDINHIIGGSAQIPLFIVQYACWTSPHQSNQAAAPAECQGMIDLYNANSGKIFLVGNSYHLPWFSPTDGVTCSPKAIGCRVKRSAGRWPDILRAGRQRKSAAFRDGRDRLTRFANADHHLQQYYAARN